MDIVVIGYAGLSGSREICGEKQHWERLCSRYSAEFLSGIRETDRREEILSFLSEESVPEAFVREAADGGVFAALWFLLRENGYGASFRQQDIPLRQQTVEICEFFGLNPYRLSAKGCFLVLSTEGEALSERARQRGISAAVTGWTEKGAAIRRIDGAETAYLRRPEPDELLRLYRDTERKEEKEDVG